VIAVVQKVCYIYSYPISLCDIDLSGNKNISRKSGFKKPYLSWTLVKEYITLSKCHKNDIYEWEIPNMAAMLNDFLTEKTALYFLKKIERFVQDKLIIEVLRLL